MEITPSLKFALKDPEWFKKFCIGVGVLIVPIVSFAWYGYLLETSRRIARGDERLPEWSPFGQYFTEGLKFGVAKLIYFIPQLTIAFGSLFAAMAFLLPPFNDAEDVFRNFLIFTIVLIAMSAFSILYRIVFQFVQPEMVINFLQKQSFGSLFEWGRFWDLFQANRGEFLKASGYSIALIILGSIIQYGLQILLSFMPGLGNMLAALGAIMAMVWADLATYHLYGQMYARLTQAE